jgi:glutathione S-transferase
MQLYFSPLACSMATRIALYEAGASASFCEIDPKTKLTLDGQRYLDIHPLGLVPALRTDDDQLITENAAILQYVARRFPDAQLAPSDEFGVARLQQWLCFIGTELHKAVFAPLLSPSAADAVKQYALDKAPARLALIERHLQDREFLLDHFSVADAYLVTVLGWAVVTPIKLADYPALSRYVTALRTRPSVAKALAEEQRLYGLELARHRAA